MIKRLTRDAGPENVHYRQSLYLSITGGGSGGIPMMFAVDVHENRQQRMQMGKLLRLCHVVSPDDWVLSIHATGGFYRSLDLTTETMENAGATVLSGGNYMTPQEIIQALLNYHVNVLTGDGSQVVQAVSHISTLPAEERAQIKLNRIIYTSEPLTTSQRAFIRATLGDIKICSVMGSAEAGPWTIGNPDLTRGHGAETDSSGSAEDFVFDTRSMLIEIFPPHVLDSHESLSAGSNAPPPPLPMGDTGLIVQTSLQRLRNPLVRYITGDVGSVHPLPESANQFICESERKHLRVLRMHGRDRRFSFKWYGVYIEFENMKAVLQSEDTGILQWQVVLGQLESNPQTTLEVRLLRAPARHAGILSDQDLTQRLHTFFLVLPENQHLFRLVFLKDMAGFERSSTAGKVINFIDRLH